MAPDVQHDPSQTAALEIQLWSDVICPWCWIGEARLRRALDQTGLTPQTRITMRAYQLDPAATGRTPVLEFLSGKMGGTIEQAREMAARPQELAAELGLTIDNERAIVVNTLKAHELIAFARTEGRDADLMSRLHRAHFTDGADVSDPAVLIHAAGDVGLDEAEAERALQTDAFASTVVEDREGAARIGVQGVPFFVLARRFAVSGAQDVETFVSAVDRAIQASAVR